ncbi:MAG: hypothetical protein IPF58_16425 [Saprospirales bacterium]|nr:hypothetical protein [Saprospirales bacterium]
MRDILGINDNKNLDENNAPIHEIESAFSNGFVFLLFVIGFKVLNQSTLIDLLLKLLAIPWPTFRFVLCLAF